MNLIICITVWFRIAVAGYYFHEASRVIVSPDPLKDHKTFGFSLGYQHGTASLIVGAPHSDLKGKIFTCPLSDIFANKTYCEDINIDVDKLAPYDREYTPNLKLNLGVSVAAASDYVLTCAPLWTLDPVGVHLKNFSYGTCFTYNGTAHRYHGMIERHQSTEGSVHPRNILRGGTGWRTLVDQTNEMLLIGKVSLGGDIVYVNSSNPLGQVTSLMAKRDSTSEGYWKYFADYQLLGNSMTTGKFFDDQTVYYAVSATSLATMEGTIHFLYAKVSKNKKKLKMLKKPLDPKQPSPKTIYVNIKHDTAGSMFGAAMSSVDLNNDGLSELLVGAPVQNDQDTGSESGAVHIYIGGDVRTVTSSSRHRVIVSGEDGSRFGSSIANSDVDGDNYPEIFVSAPYEHDGVGAVYILLGYELTKDVIENEIDKEVALTKLEKTQKIFFKDFKTFGYSLQSIPDMNDNGCDELAIGAPGIDEMVVLRCIPAVNVTVSVALVGAQIVKEQDNNFTVNVCIRVKHLKGRNFTIELKSTNEVIGNGALIEAHQRSFIWTISGSELEEVKCEDVVIKLSDNEPGEFSFLTEVEMDEEKIINNNEFSKTWVMVSSQSLTKASYDISRYCTGKDCDPDLTVNVTWSESDDSYELGSSNFISATLTVKNNGNSSYEACMVLRVAGASVMQIGCGDHFDGYKCYMPKPLRRYAVHEVPIIFNMSQPSNQQNQLQIEASVFELCNQQNVSKEFKWILPFKVDPNQVILKSLGNNQTVTDVKIDDARITTVNDVHEYWIVNGGSLIWKNTTVLIVMDKQPFIQSYRIHDAMYGCEETASPEKQLFTCTLDLLPNATVKIIATSIILKSQIMSNLREGKLELNSSLTLSLSFNKETMEKVKTLTTFIRWQKEKSLGQNKSLIIFLAILVALFALALVIFILYKMEFFKRNDKTRLEALKQEHTRRQSAKRSMSVATTSHDGLDMEVEDDSPFEIVDITDPILGDKTVVNDTKL